MVGWAAMFGFGSQNTTKSITRNSKTPHHNINSELDESSTDTYAMLAHASEGFSCRDMKEVCEHAERICATRTIEKIEGKLKTSLTPSSQEMQAAVSAVGVDLPVVDDYLLCLRTRRAQTGTGKAVIIMD